MPPSTPPADRTSVPPAAAERAREARARALAEQGFDATCVWVLDGSGPGAVIEWPAPAERLYAVPAAHVLGLPRHLPMATAPVHGAWDGVVDALRNTGRWEGELSHEGPDGRQLLTDSRLLLVPPGEDRAAAESALVVEIARDVTARRTAEAALRASENRLAAIIESALDAIVTVDEGQRVVLFNAAAERLFGVAADEAIGASLDRFIPARFRSAHRGYVAEFGATDAPARMMSPARGVPIRGPAGTDGRMDRAARPGTVLGLRADGTEFPIEAAISQARTPAGRLYTVIVRDVSERVRIEGERAALVAALEAERARLAESARGAEEARGEAETARREAESASHAKSAFLATMSHELRTPLNAVLGYAELLELGIAGTVSEPQRRYLDRIAVSGRHLLGLMDDILDLSKIEAGHMTVGRRRCAAPDAVQAALAVVRPQAAARAIVLADAGCDGVAYVGDEHRTRQILVNLLSNAVKFTAAGGRVTVECAVGAAGPPRRQSASPGSWIALRVTDTGIGIPPEHHELVFGTFQQVDPDAAGPYRRTQGGTGLGLAISRELARLMGGDLTLESEPGRGSRFTLWLPAADAPPAADAAKGRVTVGPLLADSARRIVAAWVDRLRGDPLVPLAARASRAELEDHMASFLADFAQQFVILDDATAARNVRVVLVRDGTDIRGLLSRRHGIQRARLGWDEAALAREFAVLGEELERVLVRRLTDVPAGAVDDARALVRTWLADAADESAAAMRTARADDAGMAPAAPAAPDPAR